MYSPSIKRSRTAAANVRRHYLVTIVSNIKSAMDTDKLLEMLPKDKLALTGVIGKAFTRNLNTIIYVQYCNPRYPIYLNAMQSALQS